jgi:GrpB-like predicted nucleotidyltransferase (UPF0157 family)
MPNIPIDEIVNALEFDVNKVERVAYRQLPHEAIAVVDYDENWKQQYEEHCQRITKAIAPAILYISHVGSTSVPGCPAKAVIDIDIIVHDVSDCPLMFHN